MQMPSDSQKPDDPTDDSKEDKSAEDLPPEGQPRLDAAQVRILLKDTVHAQESSAKMRRAMQRGDKLWGDILSAAYRPGNNDGPACAKPTFQKSKQPVAPPPGKRKRGRSDAEAKQRIYPKNAVRAVRAWRASLEKADVVPDAQQLRIIDVVIERLVLEANEEEQDAVGRNDAEPTRMFVHGLPGSGKSRIITWLQTLFTEVLGWTSGVEFQTAAPMNSMAALVKGVTLHSASRLGKNLVAGNQAGGKRDPTRRPNELYTDLQHRRWMLLDEVENASAELLAASNKQHCDASRGGHRSYARRRDESRRIFGGLNLVLFGDLWQVPPVRTTSIAANPGTPRSERVAAILEIFWTRGAENSLTHAYHLDVSHRSKDKFLNAFLAEARDGSLSWTMYEYFHGYPTQTPGSWLPFIEDAAALSGRNPSKCETRGGRHPGYLECQQDHCFRLWTTTWPKLFREGTTGDALLAMECDVCKQERRRRNRLLDENDTDHLSQKFAAAPYIHPFNAPKTFVFQARALHFARAWNRVLLWSIARDIPLTRDDEHRSAEGLRKARTSWLKYPETKTGNLLGMLPLVEGMPLRFTENWDVARGACKHSVCELVGWLLSDEDTKATKGYRVPEVVLIDLPLELYVRLIQVGDETGLREVLAIKPQTAQWERGPGAAVRRHGFPLVPNFGGTAHSFTGATLPAAIVDLLRADTTPSRQSVPTSYVAVSRCKDATSILLAQPFAPYLFRLGPQAGPHLLLQWILRKLTAEDLC
jgi:hypothetical protein